MVKPIICGLDSLSLLDYEKNLLSKHKPLGVILFKKNIESAKQLKELIKDVKKALNHDYIIISIDQEGGRVQRIKPPICKNHIPLLEIGKISQSNGVLEGLKASFLHSYKIACELKDLGINLNFAPIADLYNKNGHSVIGDRAYLEDPNTVSKLVNSSARGFLRGGIAPTTKHIPGHGRTIVDTHEEKSYIDTSLQELEKTDFIPFKKQNEDVLFSMVSHMYYNKIDKLNPATTSKIIVNDIIRENIGFKGVLISDCISMKALEGSLAEKANKILNAGVDIVLSSWDSKQEKQELLESIQPLDANSKVLQKIAKALSIAKNKEDKRFKNYINFYEHKYNKEF